MTDEKPVTENADFELVQDVERDDLVPMAEDMVDASDAPHADVGDTSPPHGDPMSAV